MPRRTHAGDYVLKGERDLLHGKDTIRLRTGDAVFYDAAVPHAAGMVKGKPCRLMAVAASRDYLFHGDLTRLLREDGKQARA